MVDLTALSDIEILGLTIFGESRGERVEGQIAVGCVIRNRFLSNRVRYKNYYDVCLQFKQFSCWNVSDSNRAVLEEIASQLINGQSPYDMFIKQCLFIASGIVNLDLIDTVNGSKYYMTTKLLESDNRPHWAVNVIKFDTIGNHSFFNV